MKNNIKIFSVAIIFFGTNIANAQTTYPTTGTFNLPAGKTITITYEVDIIAADCDGGAAPAKITAQGTVSGNNFMSIPTDDPSIAGLNNPTETKYNVDGILAGSTISATSVCTGGTIDLNANCPVGSTVNWYTENTNGASVATGSLFSPINIINNTSYFAACQLDDCTSSRILVGSVVVNAYPNATITASNSVCQNSTLNLSSASAGGGASYTWGGNGIVLANSNTTTAIPTSIGDQTYTLTVTNSSNCTATSSINVMVNEQPVVTTNAMQTICEGTSTTISATCINTPTCPADTYSWDNGAGLGQSVLVSPATNTTYTVTASSSVTGCSNTASTVVNIAQITLPTTYTFSTQNVSDNPLVANNCEYLAKVVPTNFTGNATVSVWVETVPPFVYVPRHYEITPASSPSNSNGTITLYYKQTDFDSYNSTSPVSPLPSDPLDLAKITNFQLVKYSGTSPNGLPSGYSGSPTIIPQAPNAWNTGEYIFEWNAGAEIWEITFPVEGFSGFFAKSISQPLPVNLISFSGKKTGENENTLTWKTSNEKNFENFEIQRSFDAKAFESIGIVKGNKAEVYEFVDKFKNSLSSAIQYYRLKMNDLDGKFNYSKIISIDNSAEKSIVGIPYPNPSLGKSTIQIDAIESGNWTITTYDLIGKAINTQTKYLQKGINHLTIENLAKGVSFLKFENGKISEIRKVLNE